MSKTEKDATLKSHPDSEYRFFLYDPEGEGFLYFKSEQARDEFSEGCIQEYLGDGWDESVGNIVAGEVTHICKQHNRVDRPSDDEIGEDSHDEDGNYWGGDWSYLCDYKLSLLTGHQSQVDKFAGRYLANKLTGDVEANAIMEFARIPIGAYEAGFIDQNTLTIAELYRSAQHYVKDTYDFDTENLVDIWGEDFYKELSTNAGNDALKLLEALKHCGVEKWEGWDEAIAVNEDTKDVE